LTSTIRWPDDAISESNSWSSRAVAVMKPSTWRARSVSKSMRSRCTSFSVLAISEV